MGLALNGSLLLDGIASRPGCGDNRVQAQKRGRISRPDPVVKAWTEVSGYWVMTRKNLVLGVPGVTLKENDPVLALFVFSGVHRFIALATFVELTRAKGWLTGPVPEMATELP